jgi:SAM-dependent methyltransferase
MPSVPDPIFGEMRLAEIYDWLDADRGDLAAYAAIVEELGARRVLDVGCGTGTFACLLAATGFDVVGLDLAAASLEVARRKPHADKVRWFHGAATDLPPLEMDLAVMTGNVAQVFIADEEWQATLLAVRTALRTGGALVFETRDPSAEAWRTWDREHTYRRVEVPDIGVVETWIDLLEVRGDLVSFRHTWAFESDGAELTSNSTIRFRGRAEVSDSLVRAGFVIDDIRDAPDRPGKEIVYLACRAG